MRRPGNDPREWGGYERTAPRRPEIYGNTLVDDKPLATLNPLAICPMLTTCWRESALTNGGYPQMVNIASLLDKAKVIHSLKSDYKLAIVMGVQHGSLRNYRDGKTLPDARVIMRICELTGDDPALLAAEIEAQRAKTDEARALWSEMAKRLAAAAAAGIVSASVMAGPTLPPKPANGDGLYLMLSGKFSHRVRLRRHAHRRKIVLHRSC